MTAEIRSFLFSSAAAVAIIAVIAIGAACAATAHAQRVDESLPPLADLTITSENRDSPRVIWTVRVKNNTVGAHPGMHVHLVKVRITISAPERSTSTQVWTIRDLAPGASRSRGFLSLYNIPGVTTGPAKVPQRLYAEIIESDPAESPRFGFNNDTEHWAIENRRAVLGGSGATRFTNGDFAIDDVWISDRSPQPGGAATFTLNTSNSRSIPGIQFSRQDHTLFDVQVKISLSPGLSFADTQPEAPSHFNGSTTFDTSTGIWNVGAMPRRLRDSPLSFQVAVNLTAHSLDDLPLEERCLTAEVVNAVPWFANDPLKRANDTATACLGTALLSKGETALFHYLDCVGATSTPCTDADTLELVVERDGSYLQSEEVVVKVSHLQGREGSIWSTGTASEHSGAAPQREGTGISFQFVPSGWSAYRWAISDVSPKQRPGALKIIHRYQGDRTLVDTDTMTSLGPVNLNTRVTSRPYPAFVTFGTLGTYKINLTVGATKSGTAYTATSTYTFHVGPELDLEVRDAGANPEVSSGQSAYTILAVNNGPDTAPAVRVTGLPTGVTEFFASEGSYDSASGVWTIGELRPGYDHRPSVYAAEGAALTLIAASGNPITAEIENTQDYCVRIKDDDPDPENDLECTGSAQTGYTDHSTAYYDHVEGNNTTMVTRRAGTLDGRHPGAATTTVAIHGAELALLSWSPVENLYDYPVTMYEIERSPRDGSPSWDAFTDADEMFHYAHSGGGGGNLAYRVRAVNEFGVKGPWSQVETEEQMVRGPSAPGNLMATVDGVSVSLSWSAPTDNRGSSLDAYRIDRQPTGGAVETPERNYATTTRTYDDSGLQPGQRYCYRVAGVNANGDVGDFSEWVCATTEDAPGAPASLSATAKGKDAVTLTWNAPAEDGGSAISGYRIDYTKDGGGWQNQVSDSATTTREYEHTGLDAGADYCYRVAAINENGMGLFSGQACATTETVPGAPRSLDAAAKGENAVTLTWRAPSSDGGSAVTGYRIEHSDNDGANWETLVSDSATTTREYEHASLAAGSRHCYRVAAVNTHGEGPLSGQACATTDGAPSAPRNLDATPISETSIRLTWDEPSSDGGEAVTGYLLEYYDGAEWLALESNLAPTTRTYTHTERDAGTNYCYRVAAINSNGTGEYSGQACATTTGAPDAPENLSAKADGKTSIILTWDKPTDTGGATIIGYRIDYQTDGGSEWITLEHDYDRTTYGHTGLLPGATYSYRVAATHDNGTGPFSAEVSATTEGAATDLPSEPENLRFTAVGRNQVTLKWDPPSVGGEVTYYERRYDHDDATIARVSGSTRQATIGGLIEGQTHDFQVRAGNSLGVGEWSPPVQANLGGLGIAPSPLELDFKKNAQGEYGTASFRVRMNRSPKWPMSVGLHWDGDVCLTDSLPYQQFKILLPDNPQPSRKFWDDGYWGPSHDRYAAPRSAGIQIEVDASRCSGGETAVVYLDLGTLPFEQIAGASLWEFYNLDRAEWEQKWGIPDEYQSGPSIRLRAVE